MRVRAPLIALLLLSACGLNDAGPPDLRSALTRAQLDTRTTPLLLVELELTGQQATLTPFGQNGTVTTWRTGDGVGLSLDDGILTATRGLGFDRMTSDIGNTAKLIAGGPLGSYYTRTHSVLVEDNQTRFDVFQCRGTARTPEVITIIGQSRSTTRIEEHCVSPLIEMTNIYWVGSDGLIWKSRQWISTEAGYATVERLVR